VPEMLRVKSLVYGYLCGLFVGSMKLTIISMDLHKRFAG
jgi:hypothetical protein